MFSARYVRVLCMRVLPTVNVRTTQQTCGCPEENRRAASNAVVVSRGTSNALSASLRRPNMHASKTPLAMARKAPQNRTPQKARQYCWGVGTAKSLPDSQSEHKRLFQPNKPDALIVAPVARRSPRSLPTPMCSNPAPVDREHKHKKYGTRRRCVSTLENQLMTRDELVRDFLELVNNSQRCRAFRSS